MKNYSVYKSLLKTRTRQKNLVLIRRILIMLRYFLIQPSVLEIVFSIVNDNRHHKSFSEDHKKYDRRNNKLIIINNSEFSMEMGVDNMKCQKEPNQQYLFL